MTGVRPLASRAAPSAVAEGLVVAQPTSKMVANNVCFQAVATVTSMVDLRRLADRLGGLSYIHATLADATQITVETRDARGYEIGRSYRFAFDPGLAFLFDGDGRRA